VANGITDLLRAPKGHSSMKKSIEEIKVGKLVFIQHTPDQPIIIGIITSIYREKRACRVYWFGGLYGPHVYTTWKFSSILDDPDFTFSPRAWTNE
jgi:hypothetical protein